MYQNNSLNQYPAFWSVTILIFGQTDFENMWLEVWIAKKIRWSDEQRSSILAGNMFIERAWSWMSRSMPLPPTSQKSHLKV